MPLYVVPHARSCCSGINTTQPLFAVGALSITVMFLRPELSCHLNSGPPVGQPTRMSPQVSSHQSVAGRFAPFAPGGPTDGIARKLANGLTLVTGKTFVVENKPGAQAILGTVFVKDAKPDGYTLLLNETTGVFAINPAITNPPPFDSNKDFTPISLIASGPIFLLVNSALPVKNLNELIELSKKILADFLMAPLEEWGSSQPTLALNYSR